MQSTSPLARGDDERIRLALLARQDIRKGVAVEARVAVQPVRNVHDVVVAVPLVQKLAELDVLRDDAVAAAYPPRRRVVVVDGDGGRERSVGRIVVEGRAFGVSAGREAEEVDAAGEDG